MVDEIINATQRAIIRQNGDERVVAHTDGHLPDSQTTPPKGASHMTPLEKQLAYLDIKAPRGLGKERTP